MITIPNTEPISWNPISQKAGGRYGEVPLPWCFTVYYDSHHILRGDARNGNQKKRS
jgi:hypothetical protein